MPSQDQMQEGSKAGVLSTALRFRPGDTDEDQFWRADLIFTDVDHSDLSYEVRVYLNNLDADDATPRAVEQGYAGRYIVFGHGACFGDLGHCEVPTGPRAAHDLRPRHPLTPQKKIVTITSALKRVLEENPDGLETVTLVPITQAPLRRDRKLDTERFKFGRMELRIYG